MPCFVSLVDHASNVPAQRKSQLVKKDHHGVGVVTDRVHDCLEMTLVFRALDKTCSSANETVARRSSHNCVSFASFTSTVTN